MATKKTAVRRSRPRPARAASGLAAPPARAHRSGSARRAAGSPRGAAAEPRWHRRKEQRPGEILAAALEEFVERGYAATRLEDVARRAGVTKGTMYRYFAGKSELFQAVVRSSVVPQIEAFERVIAESQGDSRELLVRFANGWMEKIYRSPVAGLAKLVTAEAANFPELARFYQDEVIERAIRAVKRVLTRGIERGEFRPVDVDAAAFVLRAPFILASIWKHSMNHLESHRLDERRLVETYLEMMLRGLLASPGREAAHA